MSNNAITYKQFMKNHRTSEKYGVTHTRIGNSKSGGNILPGKYIIPDEELNMFYKLYHTHVFVNKQKEYLTECQYKNGKGPILIDMDFRYSSDITEKQHDSDMLNDIASMYMDNILKLIEIPEDYDYDKNIDIYVMEKPNVNTMNPEYTKDGIHIIINIQMDHIMQCMLRELVLKEINDLFDSLPLTNSFDLVLDDGISKGYTNWQLYGSCKPDNETYKVIKVIKYKFCKNTNSDGSIFITPNEDDTYDISEESDEMSSLSILCNTGARHKCDLSFDINKSFESEYNSKKNKGKQKEQNKNKNKENTDQLQFTKQEFNFDVSEITNKKILETLIEKMIETLNTNKEYLIIETHKYLMCLPENFYNDYDKWIRCGWALHNTDFRLFLSWMYFSAQSDKFNYNDITQYYDDWCSMEDNGLTNKSIIYWAKEFNEAEYIKILHETVEYYIIHSTKSMAEWDVAQVIFQYYKEQYRCADYDKNVWYKFKNHRWVLVNPASLRNNISKTISKLYFKIAEKYTMLKLDQEEQDNDEQVDRYSKIIAILMDIANKLKKTAFKTNVIKECKEIFYEYDPKFFEKLDTNRDLLCFNNGVIDFDKKIFRDGAPEDYISLSTKINYLKYNKINTSISNEITQFMEQLFPIKELNRYMWEHLASTLNGTNKNQTFNIYNGNGSNGKSKLVELMSIILGDYKGVVPISLVTGSRDKIGSISPEKAALKGLRYAVMNEPSKGDKLNDGIMKELTGEDPITGRALYMPPITFVPQFSLVVCTNNLFDIKSNDDGTWRRIRLCEFLSKFKKNPVDDDPDNPYQFIIDNKLNNKFSNWKETFMSMLIKIAFDTDCIVTDCEMVLAASNEYRNGQDYLMEFFKEKITKGDGIDKIRKNEASTEFTNWYKINYGKSIPKAKELYEFLDKKLGKFKVNGWYGYKIIYDNDEDDESIISSIISDN
jgi:P4 family phage/plasmid primase-like protien